MTERTLDPDRIGSAAQAPLSHTLSSGFFDNKKFFVQLLLGRMKPPSDRLVFQYYRAIARVRDFKMTSMTPVGALVLTRYLYE